MSVQWNHRGRTPQARIAARLQATAESTPLRHRIDAVLMTLILIITLLGTSVWTAGVAISDRNGFIDPPIVQPLADERLTTNIRDNLSALDVRDAVFHAPERRIYIAQEGGTIHTYDPATRLWATEHPFAGEELITSNIVQLRSGCGRDPSALRSDACPDPETIWALSERGGLLQRVANNWQVVVGDVAWMGKSGKPVSGASISAAALSGDGRWLLVGTRGEGVGLYDNSSGTWSAQKPIREAAENPSTTTVIIWWQGRFWIGGPEGLITLQPAENTPTFATAKEHPGAVLDLDLGSDGLYVLERRRCAEGDDACLWLGRLSDPDRAPVVLLDEQAVYTGLNRESLVFAQQWDHRLVVAGASGIYAYTIDLHRWEQLFEQAVSTTLALPDGSGFYFVYPGGAGRIDAANGFKLWKLEGDRVIRLLFGRDTSEVLALTGNGNLLSLGPGETLDPIYLTAGTSFDPATFTLGANLDQHVFFLGPEGVMLHNPVTRSYLDIPLGSIPEWMKLSNLRAFRAGDAVYFLDENGSKLEIYPASVQDLLNPAVYTDTLRKVTPSIVAGPTRRLWDWGSLGLGLIDAQGSVYSVSNTGVARRTGEPRANLDRETILDVTAQNDDLIVATDSGVRYYSSTERGWVTGPDPKERIEELGIFGSRLLGRNQRNELIEIADQSQQLIGDHQGSRISDSDLSDARLVDTALYLAGAGQVERYSIEQRRITTRWQMASTGSVRISAIVNGEPLAQIGDAAFLGERPIDPAAGPIIALAANDTTIWTTRRTENSLYLKGYAIGANFNSGRCLFRNPRMPGAATRIEDARRLPDGMVAVSTDAGIMFYAPQNRSWYMADQAFGGAGARLYLVDDHLAVAEPLASPTTVALIPLSSIKTPASCDTGTIKLQAQPNQVQAVAFNENAGRAAWITPAGAVIEWHSGVSTEILAAPEAPNAAEIRRAYQRSDHVLFTGNTMLWRYNLKNHSWQEINLNFSNGISQTLDMNVEGNDIQTITAHGAGDRWYVGQLAPAATTVTMKPLIAQPIRTFSAQASELLDVSTRNGQWTFLLNDRLKYFDPASRSWSNDILLGSTDTSRTLQQALERYIAVGNGGKTWWVATNAGAQPTSFALFDLPQNEQLAIDQQGVIWRLDRNGQLRRCEADQLRYSCVLANAPPMPVIETDVRAAFNWNSVTIFDTTKGLRAFDPLQGAEVPISGTLRLAQTVVAREYGDRLLLHDGSTLVALERDGELITARSWTGVTALVVDNSNTAWARFGTDWRRATGNDWLDPLLSNGRSASVEGVRIFVSEGKPAVGIDGTGRLYTWAQRLTPQSLALPAMIDPHSVDLLIAGANNSWWLRSGSQLLHVVEGTCTPLAPTPTLIPVSQTPVATTLITATAVATTRPAATPQPVPCLVQAGQVNLPSSFHGPILPALITPTTNTLNLSLANSDSVQISVGAASTAYQITATSSTVPQPGVTNEWPRLRSYLRPLALGGTAYDPMINLVIDPQGGALNTVRPSRSERLAERAVLQPSQTAPMDTGWLRWDRGSGQFVLQGKTIRKDEFIRAGALIIEPVEAVLAETSNRFHIANQYGIWSFDQADARLDGSAIRFTPVQLQGITGAAHGRFLTAGGDITPKTSAVQQAQTTETISIDDLKIVEQIRTQRIAATISQAGLQLPALAERGFRFDQGRSGIAYDGAVLSIQTDAGIHPALSLGPFDAGPAIPGRLRSEPNNTLLVDSSGTWYQRDRTGWNSLSADPTQSRLLLSDQIWNWELQAGRLTIDLSQGQPYRFGLGNNGSFGFSSDQLRAATSHESQLLVMSEAFIELADTPDQLATLSAARLAPESSDRLESLTLADGSHALFRHVGSVVSRWDQASQKFSSTAPTDNPDLVWRLIDDPRLRMTRQGSQVTKELLVDQVSGGSNWVPFTLIDGRFPFDVVTVFDTEQNQLFVGSAAGLQVYSTGQGTGFNQISRLYDLSGISGGGLAPVTRVGRPKANPGLLMARGGICVELQAGQAAQPCTASGLLDTRLRITSDLWEWTADQSGVLAGTYYGRGGSSSLPVKIVDGRFAHDRLRDIDLCADQAFSVWEDGWITVHPDTTIALRQGLVHDPLAASSSAQLLCLERDIRLKGATAPTGMYLLEAENRFRHYTGSDWELVRDQRVIALLQERLEHPPLVDQAALRLMTPADDQTFVFEQQSLAGDWYPLQWDGDRVEVDRWREVVAIDNRLWVATSAGLVRFERRPDGRALLNPDSVMVVREPLGDDGLCPITDLVYANTEVVVRCNTTSKEVYAGTLDGTKDTGVFSVRRAEQDPFAEQVLVSREQGDAWEWALTGRRDGDPGRIVATRVRVDVPEEIELVGGRFDFDEIDSLALFRDNLIEIGSRGGWFSVPRSDFAADAWERPTRSDPAAVRSVGIARIGDAQFLCLVAPEKTTRLAVDGTSEAGQCPEYLGEDDLWRYERARDTGQMIAPGKGGEGERELVDGRFSDDLVTGLPLVHHESENIFYSLPTRAGIIRMDTTLAKRSINATFVQLTPGQNPNILYLWNENQPAYLAGSTLYSLENDQPLADLALDLPETAIAESIEDGPRDLLILRWSEQGRRGWSIVAREAGLAVGRNRLVVDLAPIARYQQYQLDWEGLPQFAEIEIGPERATLYWGLRLAPQSFDYPQAADLVAAISYGDRILLFGRNQLYEVNIEPALLQASQGR